MRHLLEGDFLSLDGTWEARPDGERGSTWRAIRVPGVWERQGFPADFEGPLVYRRDFDVPTAWKDRRIYLRFEAVSYHCEVSVNGALVGEHDGLWTPFEFDVTPYLRFGQLNTVSVRVFKPGRTYPLRSCLAGFIPDVSMAFGGIWKSVGLVGKRTVRIESVHIDADASSGRVDARVSLTGVCTTPQEARLRAVVKAPDTGAVVAETVSVFAVKPGIQEQRVQLQVAAPRLWDVLSPHLYTLRVSVEAEGSVRDVVEERFGFRRVEVDGDRILLKAVRFTSEACCTGAGTRIPLLRPPAKRRSNGN